jgi:predicted PurR-regulated permease PerM
VASESRDNLKHPGNALFTGILIIAVLYFAREVFVPLALAALIAFVLAPAALWLERSGLKRTPAALIVILLSLAGVAVLGWALLGQIYSLAVEFPQYQQNLAEKIESLHLDSAGKLSGTVEMLNGLNKRIRAGSSVATPVVPVMRAHPTRGQAHGKASVAANQAPQPVSVRIEAPEESMVELASRTMAPLLHPLATTFIVVIFLVFMLVGREDIRDRGHKLAGSGRMHVTTTAIQDAARRVSRYLRMQLVVNLSYGAIAGLALGFIGVPHPLLWAVLICLLRFVPYVGIMMAAAGPLLLAGAVSPLWGKFIWTVITFGTLEIVAANFVEPMLYGASTGISALAVLIAAVFWTFLWGLPGLLLSTPLTVCLVVIGRQIPRLHYLEVLFGERTGLPPSEHFYQRMLASNTRDARELVEVTLQTKPRAEVYDGVIIPALTMIEEATHSEEMSAARAEEILQSVEELVEDLAIGEVSAGYDQHCGKSVLCIPARDFADEIACQLAQQILAGSVSTRTVPAGASLSDVQELTATLRPDVICVVGVPPRAIRYTKVRCHQVRSRFPDSIIAACILGEEQELSSLRSRIPAEDAQHVVTSLQLLQDYLTSVLHPDALPPPLTQATSSAVETTRELSADVLEVKQIDPFDGPAEGMFDRLATNLARSFDAPIALITAAEGAAHFWETQCGLPEDSFATGGSPRDCAICTELTSHSAVSVVADTAEDEQFADDAFFKLHGIRFCAAAPIKDHHHTVIGSLCVMDTRPGKLPISRSKCSVRLRMQ